MEIYDFEYQNKHFKNRAYNVFPLSNNGINQYLGGESYTHKFIDPVAPKERDFRDGEFTQTFDFSNKRNFATNFSKENDRVLNKIYSNNNNKAEFNNEFNHIYNLHQKEEAIPEENHKIIEEISNEKESVKDENILDDNNSERFENLKYNLVSNNINSNNDINNKQKSSLLNNIKRFKTNSEIINFKGPKENMKVFESKNSALNISDSKPKGKSSIFSISTEKGYNFKKANLNPLSRRLNYTSSDFFRTINDHKDHKKNNKSITTSRYDKNYLKNMNLFMNSKSYMEMDKIKDERIRKYDGFQSFAIPSFNNFDTENIDSKKSPIYNLAQKISKSCIGGKKNNEENVEETQRNLKQDPYEESEKLRKIMFLQTNSDFLKKNKMPEMKKFIETPGIKINSNSRQLTKKNMGESYNPYNYLPGRDCETRRRNVTGALFNH